MPRLADLTAPPPEPPATVPAGTLRNLNDPMLAVQKAQTIGAPNYPPMMGKMPMGPGMASALVASWQDPGKGLWLAKRMVNDTVMNWAGEKAKEILSRLQAAK